MICRGVAARAGEADAVLLRAYVSGSAYKIVNNRAYHHGTMLISTRLDLLGDLLRVEGVSCWRGCCSVRVLTGSRKGSRRRVSSPCARPCAICNTSILR